MRPNGIIDFHAHVVDLRLLDVCGAHSVQTGFGRRPFPRPGDGSTKGQIYSRMADPHFHIAHMDAAGIDASVISVSSVLQNTWWANAERDLQMTRQLNDMVADWTARHPKRFIGSFTVPMTDMNNALSEFDRAVTQLGFAVIGLPASINGAYLGEARFEPLWDEIERHGIIAFIHPHGTTDPWFQNYRMWNSIGQSIEEVKVMSSLIYEGMLDRHPQLKIVMAHGGGYFPHYLGRLDRNVTNYPDTMANIADKPSSYLRRFYYDTCVYDPAVLQALIEKVGADRLIMGSDFPVGENDPVNFVASLPHLSRHDVELITKHNAAALLRR
ncbi:MAG TPA: amidohydrolase family protein [Pseudolabrys sp.]|nr:amidohydrolase family protein [Pseudolabrys sp.]